MRRNTRKKNYGQTSDVFDEKAWVEAYEKETYGGINFNYEEVMREDAQDKGLVYQSDVVVTAPGVIVGRAVEIVVPDICTTHALSESANFQALAKCGFIFPEKQIDSDSSYNPYNLVSTIVQNSGNMFYNGEKVIDVITPTFGLSSLPRKYINNLSVPMNGTRIIVSGSGSFNLMGCAECSGDEDEAIIIIKLESGVVKSLLVTASNVLEVESQEVAYFRRDTDTGVRYLIYPPDLDSSVKYTDLEWMESLHGPGIVCVDGQFFSVPLSRIVNLRNVQTKTGSRFLARNSEIVVDVDYRVLSDVVLCDLDCPILSKPAYHHSPSNVASIEIVQKVRNSVLYHEMKRLYRGDGYAKLVWNCGEYGLNHRDQLQPSSNLLQVCKRRHKRVSILLCMAQATLKSTGHLSVFEVYKQMENLPEIFIFGKNYLRYSWSGVCDDFYRYDSSSAIEKTSSYYVSGEADENCKVIGMPSQVVRVLVVCRSNFVLRGLNHGVYFSDAHLRMWRGACDLVPLFWSLDDCHVPSPKIFANTFASEPCDLLLISKGVRVELHLEPDDRFEEYDSEG